MIDRINIAELRNPDLVGEEVPIAGFIDANRAAGKRLRFMDVRDHTGAVQTVHKIEAGEEMDEKDGAASLELGALLSELTPESVVAIRGIVTANPSVKSRNPRRVPGAELKIVDAEILSLAKAGLPITPDTAFDTRLAYRALDLRRPEKAILFQVGTTLEAAMTEYWESMGYINPHTAKLVGTPTEGGAEVFSLDYFGIQEGYLTQSPQLAKQKAIAAGFPGFFEVGAAYRAEHSNTSRHITEFTSVDVEFPWVESHHDVMDQEENVLRTAFATVIEKHGDDLLNMTGAELTLPEKPFPRITLAEARRIVETTGYRIPDSAKDLDPESERRLCDYMKQHFGSEFVFVTDFPTELRPFYHMRHEDNPGLTKSFDLLWRGIEITTGAQREHRIDVLERQILQKGLSLDNFTDYLNNFRYGCPPHGGFGLGLNRLLAKMTSTANVSEATFQPNTPTRLTP